MKRFLFILSCLVLCISIFTVVSVFASGVSHELTYDGLDMSLEVPERFSGDYRLVLYDAGDEQFWASEPIHIDVAMDMEKCIVSPGPSSDAFTLCYRWVQASNGYTLFFYSNEVNSGESLGELYDFSSVWLEPVATPTQPSFVDSLGDVFTYVASFIMSALGGLVAIFWTGDGLTFMGVLAVCGLAISVILLFCYILSRFIRFKG